MKTGNTIGILLLAIALLGMGAWIINMKGFAFLKEFMGFVGAMAPTFSTSAYFILGGILEGRAGRTYARMMAIYEQMITLKLRTLRATGARGDQRIFGAMIESNLVAGQQKVVAGQELTYGQSITDACMGWEDTVDVLHRLADAVAIRGRN